MAKSKTSNPNPNRVTSILLYVLLTLLSLSSAVSAYTSYKLYLEPTGVVQTVAGEKQELSRATLIDITIRQELERAGVIQSEPAPTE